MTHSTAPTDLQERPDWFNDECDFLQSIRDAPELVAAVYSDEPELRLQARLRDEYTPAMVREALHLRDLRARAEKKFSHAQHMWFNRVGLEQSTSEQIAKYKAARFQNAAAVHDWCCGIGGDALAIAQHCDVHAVDLNPANCLRTIWNAQVHNPPHSIHVNCADVTTLDAANQWIHIDPDRRATGKRSRRVEDCAPGLPFMQHLTQSARGGAIKLSPASNFFGKFHDCEIELISLGGECREATIWFGELAGPKQLRATILPAGATITGDELEHYTEVVEPQAYIYDPDPAIVRAGLVDQLCAEHGYGRLDDAEEYLTSAEAIYTPLAATFRVLSIQPNNNREIRRAVRDQQFNDIEIKCRHVPIDANQVRKKLPLAEKKRSDRTASSENRPSGARRGVLIYARVAGKVRVFVCERLQADESNS